MGWELSALAVGLIGLPNALLSGYAAVWSGKRAIEKGKQIQVMALSLIVVSVLLLIGFSAGVARANWPIALMAIPLLPLGFGAGCMGAANQTQSMMHVPPAHGGTAGGVQQTSQRITTAIGNALITGVLFAMYGGGATIDGWYTGYSCSLAVIALFVSAALTLAIIFWRRSDD
jgi:hypothetical protein